MKALPQGRSQRDPYIWLGMVLSISGACLIPVFYFIVDSAALTGLGLSFVMLGLVCIALANTRPAISPEASQMMLQAGMENIAALLEELGLTGKAIYMPRSRREGRSQALVPLRQDHSEIRVDERIPGRLIVRYGRDPLDVGIAVATPGSVCLEGLEAMPGPNALEIESALSTILVGMLDIAGSVSAYETDKGMRVEVSKPKMGYRNVWFYQALGSPLASIAASVTSEAFEKPVVVARDESLNGKAVIELEVLS